MKTFIFVSQMCLTFKLLLKTKQNEKYTNIFFLMEGDTN